MYETMQLEKYGVVLKRLTHDKIELVRNWRNDPKIVQYMEFRDYISTEMQEKWFSKMDSDHHFYFIIEYDKKEIGLINIRDIDYIQKTGESGIFISDNDYLNSDVSFRSVLCIFDYFFETLNLEKVIAHILKDNKRAIQFNTMLGFELQANQENINNQLYFLEKEKYFIKRSIINRLIH